jgi:hypothetical protein
LAENERWLFQSNAEPGLQDDEPTLVAPVAFFSEAARDSSTRPGESAPAAECVPTALSESSASDPAGEGMAPPGRFTGTLQDLSVADLVQILQLTQKGAVIKVSHEGIESRLWCSAGLIVDAESGRLRGEPAVHRILALESGSMAAELCTEPRERKIFALTPHLLLEAARRKDESAELRRRLGDERRCYRVGALAAADPAHINQVELSLLQGFGNLQTLRETIDASAFGEVETLQALSRCIEAGYLVDSGTVGSQRPAPAADTHAGRARPSAGSASAKKYEPGPAHSRARPRLAAAMLMAAGLLSVGYLAGRNATRRSPPSSMVAELTPAAGQKPTIAPCPEKLELRVEPARAEIRLEPDPVSSEVQATGEAAPLAPAAVVSTSKRRVRPSLRARVREAPASAAPKPSAVVEAEARPAKPVVDEASAIIRTVDF